MATIKSRSVSVEGYSAAEDALYWSQEDGERGVRRICTRSASRTATSSIVPVPAEAVDVGMWFDPENDEPIAVTYTTGGDEHYQWMQPKFQAVYTALSKAFKGKNVELRELVDRPHQVHRRGLEFRRAHHLVPVRRDPQGGLGARRGVSRAEGREPRRARPSTATRARDGLSHPGLSARPERLERQEPAADRPAARRTEARDYSNFDWWAQFFASRGYAVLQPQFRGSDGFGYDFLHGRPRRVGPARCRPTWSTASTTSPPRASSTRSGSASPGASYGGFAALYGATHLGDVYKCAISVNGVADQGYLGRRR